MNKNNNPNLDWPQGRGGADVAAVRGPPLRRGDVYTYIYIYMYTYNNQTYIYIYIYMARCSAAFCIWPFDYDFMSL